MKKKNFEHALKLKELEEIRKHNISNYFLNQSKYHRPWMQELADRYKDGLRTGTVAAPLIPMAVLPSYYTDKRDREIAAFASLLIRDEGRYGETVSHQLDSVLTFRGLLGNHPWEWFLRRDFVCLSMGNEQNKRTGGIENWKIAKLMDILWNEHNYPIIQFSGIEDTLRRLSSVQLCSYFDIMTYLLEDCCVGQFFYKLRVLLLVLGTADGFGLGVWEIPKDQLKCPLAYGLRDFIKTWFPDYNRIGSIDDAIRQFGLRGECDFFYAWLGYKELQKRNPKGCSAYATTYLRWYDNGERKKPCKWRAIQPDIDF